MNILITGAWQGAENNIHKIESLGNKVEFLQFEKDPLPCEYEWVEGVICNGLFLSHSIEKFTRLKFIQLTSAGFDRVPMDYIKDHNIEIHNARGVYSVPMAEFSISGVLQLYKNAKFFSKNQKNKLWEKDRNLVELSGKTVCIVGCGSVGTECAKRFKAFGCRVIGVDLFARQDSNYDDMLNLDEIDRVLELADIVVLTLPLTDDTYHMFDETRFKKMKDKVVLVNIARGAVVDTDALIKALDSKIFGAVLDVFEEEPLSEQSILWDKENVILTPHNSFVGDGNKDRINEVIIKNIENRL